MLDEAISYAGSFREAVAAGCLVGAACAMLGVMVILRRVVFIGVTLSEAAAAGVAGALVLGAPPLAGAVALTLVVVSALALPFESNRLPRDAVLGFFFVLAAAASVLTVSRSGFGLSEVHALLYGDLILTTRRDLAVLAAVLVPVIVGFAVAYRPMLYAFLDRDAAKVLGIRTAFWEAAFFAMLGLAVAASSKLAGALLVFAYLVVAPSAALLVTRRMGPALAASVAAALLSTLGGMALAFHYDLPTNQTIAAVACCLFAAAAVWRAGAAAANALRGGP